MIQVFSEFDNLIAGTTTREDGNFSIADHFCFEDKQKSLDNRQKLCIKFDMPILYVPKLIHTDQILVIPNDSMANPADALITQQKNTLIGVTTADCIPVFLYASDKQVVGVVHSGRAGVKQKITTKTILKMKQMFDIDLSLLYVHIGVHICKDCYEVSQEIMKEFGQTNSKNTLNMLETVNQDLLEMNIKNISIEKQCTLCSKNIFFSHRNHDKDRMLSFIGIR